MGCTDRVSRRIAALLALIYARTSEADQSLDLLHRLLTTPGLAMPIYEASITLTELRTRWQWAPLRSDPRVQKPPSRAGANDGVLNVGRSATTAETQCCAFRLPLASL